MAPRNKVTLKKIAELLKVTPATVSKALHDSSDISDAMRKKVKKTADKLGYRPNILARTLIQHRSFLLGVIIPDLRISFFSESSRGIYERARKRNYETILMVHDEKHEIEKENLEFLSDLHVDGILLNPAPGKFNYDVYDKLVEEGIQIVCYDRKLDDYNFPSVTIDDRKASYILTCEMLRLRRRKILFLGPNKGISVARERYLGYLDALSAYKVALNPDYVIPSDLSQTHSYEKMKSALDRGIEPDAVVCVGALVAYGAGNAILDSGLSIPDDIILGEFGDNDINSRLGVPFLTINQNPYKIGQAAVDLLVQNIEAKEKVVSEHIIIETKLLRREYGIRRHRSV
ncbi:MAG: LacI family DNA-binding transcriptional regulator [Sedimentisphaerales bacterium]|nr:LacI family DNA-binding transcriptional regulator [Sedimentisphaerales bacterium]